MHSNNQQTVLPEADIVLPGPGGSSKPGQQRIHRSNHNRSRARWVVVLVAGLAMFCIRLSWRMARPVLVTTLMVTAATWIFFPIAFTTIVGLLGEMDTLFSYDELLQNTKATIETIQAAGGNNPTAELSEALPKEIKLMQQELITDGKTPRVLLNPQLQK